MVRAGGTFNSPPVQVVNVSGNFNDLRTMRSETEIKNLILILLSVTIELEQFC
jgi:hypothetical protein